MQQLREKRFAGMHSQDQRFDSSPEQPRENGLETDSDHLPTTSYSQEYEPQVGRSGRLSWLYSKLFRQGSDIQNATANHHYTKAERDRLSNVESIDYLPPNSAVYRRWLANQPHGWVCLHLQSFLLQSRALVSRWASIHLKMNTFDSSVWHARR